MYIVISYIEVLVNGVDNKKIYDDSSEKYFSNLNKAEEYKAYLISKDIETNGFGVVLSPIVIEDNLIINDLKKESALLKLTEEEKTLLNL